MRNAALGSNVVVGGGLLWLLAAVAAGVLVVPGLRPPAPQAVLAGITTVLLVAVTVIPGLRAWTWAVDMRWLVGVHLTRFVGAWFLVLYGRGELPWAFAVPGGIGDIVTAVLALGVILSGPPDTPARRGLYGAWNVFGLIDILFVVATATRLAFADLTSMAALLRLPLSLLITFLVPLIIATHVVIGLRLLGHRAR